MDWPDSEPLRLWEKNPERPFANTALVLMAWSIPEGGLHKSEIDEAINLPDVWIRWGLKALFNRGLIWTDADNNIRLTTQGKDFVSRTQAADILTYATEAEVRTDSGGQKQEDALLSEGIVDIELIDERLEDYLEELEN